MKKRTSNTSLKHLHSLCKKPNLLLSMPIAVALLLSALMIQSCSFSKKREDVLDFLKRLPNKMIAQNGDTHKLKSPELLKKYYEQQAALTALAEKDSQAVRDRRMLLQMLHYADSLGLDVDDYHAKYLRDYEQNIFNPNYDYEENLLGSEVVLTDAALSFLFDVAYGKNIKQIEFNGVDLNIDSVRISNALTQVLSSRNWKAVTDTLEPKMPEYLQLKAAYNHMRNYIHTHAEADSMNCVAGALQTIFTKLIAFNLLPENALADSFDAEQVKAAIKTFQRIVNIDTTGVADKRTLAELNFPLHKRVEQLKSSLNYWRWTGRLNEQEFIFVNLPAAYLRIVNRDSASEMGMRVIVGKPGTRTPSFTAYVSKVITYPYWTVPFSIATKEMLPKIQKDVGYLERNNFQVLDKTGKEINPASVNWQSVSRKNFRYTFRQSTGCDNALGVMKFDLNSPYSIYLHDTNNRTLFKNNNRHLSHGCVRVEKPFFLAEYLLGNSVDTSYLNQCLRTETPKDHKLKQKFPVLILYLTADVNADGELRFYKDVYGYEM
jgi:murein L,D-transpeptidase YcbB/YkuD